MRTRRPPAAAAAALALLIALLAGCGPEPAGSGAATGEAVEVTASLERIELEGGFWGLVADDGRRFLPLNLEHHLDAPRPGLRVHVRGHVEDVATYQMWGTPLRIERLRVPSSD